MKPDKMIELANEEKERTLWDKAFPFILFFSIAFGLVGEVLYLTRDRVDQGVQKFSYCNCTMFYTSVWINNDIVEQWTTPAESMTDSIKAVQKKEGERILHANK